MATPTNRRLTLADLAILIVGSALSLGLIRVSSQTLQSSGRPSDPGYFGRLVISSIILGLATVLFASRAMRPRPRWRAVFRQPGTAACLAILGHMLMLILMFWWRGVLGPIIGRPVFWPDLNLYLQVNCESGSWVTLAWATLALAQAWRPEPSWIDRSGRILGIVAIVHFLWSALNW